MTKAAKQPIQKPVRNKSRRRPVTSLRKSAAPAGAPSRPSYLAKRPTKRTIAVPGDIGDRFPDAYGMQLDGDCLSPILNDGDTILASETAPRLVGQPVIVYPTGGHQPVVKILDTEIEPWMMKLSPKSELMPLIFLSTLNPRRQIMIAVDKIEAIHGVLGFVSASGEFDGAFCRMRASEKPLPADKIDTKTRRIVREVDEAAEALKRISEVVIGT